MDNGLSIRLNRETGFRVFKPQVVVLGAFESFSFARRRRGRMGFVIWGLAECCCMRQSSSLVSCSLSWLSAIGLLLYSSVMKRCHTECSISSSCHLLRLWTDVVLPRVQDYKLGCLHIFDEKVIVVVHLLVPVPIFPFAMENFFKEKVNQNKEVLSSLSAALCVMKNVRHVLKDSSSIWVLICRRPCRRHPRSCLGYCDHRALRYVLRHRLYQSHFQCNRCLCVFSGMWREDFE